MGADMTAKQHAKEKSGDAIIPKFQLKRSQQPETLHRVDMAFYHMLLDMSQTDEEIMFNGTPIFRSNERHPQPDELDIDRMLVAELQNEE